ncbi:MAG: type II toxin-antitoxin system VapC family toxin [Pseudomonadota bacterium]|nr:type II toxin-antitoxin system VapC family toxin [Pseudomonadota bacterium]
MIYVDTSVLVALFTREGKSAAVSAWYASSSEELVSTVWCVTEFASALGIKRRTGQLDDAQAQEAWRRFERLCAGDLRLLPLQPPTFHHAAALTLDAASGLRSGDALHLAAALEMGARHMATLDDVLARNAVKSNVDLVAL